MFANQENNDTRYHLMKQIIFSFNVETKNVFVDIVLLFMNIYCGSTINKTT